MTKAIPKTTFFNLHQQDQQPNTYRINHTGNTFSTSTIFARGSHIRGIFHPNLLSSQKSEAVLSNDPILAYSRLSWCRDLDAGVAHGPQDTTCKWSSQRS
jgi:hypothetical protein